MPGNWSSRGLDLHLEVDTAGGRRAGLERALREAVRDGRLAPGSPLPSTRELAGELGLSRGTVTAAYDQLAAEGYLTARQGAVTRVADLPAPVPAPARPAPGTAAPQHDLRPGRPDVAAFPAAAWSRSTRRVLTTAPADIHGLSDPQGRAELRTALAGYLGRTRGVLTGPDRIVITSGSYQSFGLLARVLAESGTTAVAMEDPGHEAYREVVRRAGLTVLPLPVDRHGARADALTGVLAGRGSGAPGAVVVTPAHQYPTGAPLHPRRRHELCAWARASGGLVIEDDYDGEYRYDRRPVGALQGIAPDRVVYCGSASKSLGPGLRLGWMALPSDLVGPVVEAKFQADLHTGALGQLVLADLITRHDYDRHIRAGRLRYRRRRDLLVRRLGPGPRQPLPGLVLHGVAAGLHTLITLPDDGPAEPEVLAECERRGIALRGLSELWHDRADAHADLRSHLNGDLHGGLHGDAQGVLVGYAAASEHAYPAALEAFAGALGAARRVTG
ncbi:PLP-dependent aminotransferase family protein [Actinomadura scrupuli]|uniref:MocR-like pyridoxine biosynthesis transcription factor PdxR n=1 Tax=Actinomadura scrupuli TaxID=559629 RepID=UPI003D9660A1